MHTILKKAIPLLKYNLRLCLPSATMTNLVVTKELVDSLVMKSSGSWSQIEISKWPIPKLCEADEVKVSVDYCGVNFADVYNVQGILSERQPPFVFGLECVGRVIDLGDNVNSFKPGDRVACYLPEGGLFQEKVIIPMSRCFSIPLDIPSTDATALLANYLTAYFCLFHSANISSGFSLFIHSVAGGVGWAATQLAHTVADVKVYGTCSEPKHSIVTQTNGVDMALTYDNYMNVLKEGNNKFDIIIDNIGGKSIQNSLELLKPLGHLVVTGANCVVSDKKEIVEAALVSLTNNVELHCLVCGNKSISGLHLGRLFAEFPQSIHDAVQHIFQLYLLGKVKPHIDSIWQFNKGCDAIKLLADRKNVGKVLLQTNKESIEGNNKP